MFSSVTVAATVGEVVFLEPFASPQSLEKWTAAGQGTVQFDRTAARFESPSSVGKILSRSLPIEKLRGTRLTIAANVESIHVEKPPQPWNAIKVMLVTNSPTRGKEYFAPSHLYGTFELKRVSATANVPADVTEATLVLGIEATKGIARITDVELKVSAVARIRPLTPAGEKSIQKVPQFRGVMYGPKGREEDLRELKKWNVNFIRWQLHWNNSDGWRDLSAYNRWLKEALAELERWLPLCEELGIKVLVDLHSVPGGSFMVQGPWPLFTTAEYQKRFLQIWDEIPRRFLTQKAVWGYDLANEPVEGEVGIDCVPWRTLAERAARQVRKIDPDRAIVIEPGQGGGWDNLDFFEPIPLPNIVYSVHLYAPHTFTHQGVNDGHPMGVEYPGLIEGKQWDREQMRKALEPVRQYQLDYGVPILIGEFSAIRWAPNQSAERYLRDAISIFEEYGWDWVYHAFREWQGWSVEVGEVKEVTTPSTQPTKRRELLIEQFKLNKTP